MIPPLKQSVIYEKALEQGAVLGPDGAFLRCLSKHPKKHPRVLIEKTIKPDGSTAPSFRWAKNFDPKDRLQYLYAEFCKGFNK